MRIKDVLNPESMIMSLKATNKEEATNEMTDLEVATGAISDKDELVKSIWARENQSTTGIGEGIAMPHARNKSISRARVLFAKNDQGIDFDSLDGQPVHLFFMITAPDGADSTHLQALAKLSGLLVNPDSIVRLKAATKPEEIIDIFTAAEDARGAEEKAVAEKTAAKRAEGAKEDKNDKPLIVGITAYINGIAHTYMAEQALIKAGEKLGAGVRIETNGSEGVKYELTADEIKRAKSVIIASDKKVKMARFDNKELIAGSVVDGINEPEELAKDILAGKGSVYHDSGNSKEASEVKASGLHAIYQQLMNGISHTLPFVIGGGILMAISFLVEQCMGGAKTEAFIFLNNVGSMAFASMVPVLAAYIAEAIDDAPALMPGFVDDFIVTVYKGSFGGAYVASVNHSANSAAGFLGGIAAGFVTGYIVVGLKKLFKGLPKLVEGMKPMLIYSILSLFLTTLVMFFTINPISGVLNAGIIAFLNHLGTGNLVLLTVILTGMMSIDMGDPFNKTVYVFASSAFANDPNSKTAVILMAAVMVGGMVAPFATAIASAFFKNEFTDEEREAGIINWILGFSFITGGAIPFATAGPNRIIPSSVIGSAIAGALVGLLHVGVPAPHGGFWISPLATNIPGCFLTVIISLIVAAVILGFWKKPVNK